MVNINSPWINHALTTVFSITTAPSRNPDGEPRQIPRWATKRHGPWFKTLAAPWTSKGEPNPWGKWRWTWEYIICMYIHHIYIRATPGFCPGVAAYISTIHKQMILQISVIPLGKMTKVLGTIKQTRSKHPKFLWEKQKQHNIWNFYEKNRKGTRKF